MANPDVTYFVDDPAVTFRKAEETNDDADWENGMNHSASNAPGIGINQGGGAVVGTPEQFTLLDQGRPVESGGSQTPVAREAQVSQLIGGTGFVDRTAGSTSWEPTEGTENGRASSGGVEGALPENVVRFGTLPDNVNGQPNPTATGEVVPVGNSTLSDLAVGWTIQV